MERNEQLTVPHSLRPSQSCWYETVFLHTLAPPSLGPCLFLCILKPITYDIFKNFSNIPFFLSLRFLKSHPCHTGKHWQWVADGLSKIPVSVHRLGTPLWALRWFTLGILGECSRSIKEHQLCGCSGMCLACASHSHSTHVLGTEGFHIWLAACTTIRSLHSTANEDDFKAYSL